MKILRIILSPFLVLIALVAIMSVSPIYKFEEPKPFCGPDIFNPYAGYVDSIGWKKSVFHVHTKVDGLLNECDYSPAYADSCYRSIGYDIVTFSNHNELTTHPYDTALQVNVYEHGYNLYKYHKLVFGASRVMRFDNLVPFLASQKQFQLDLLRRDADFIQMNHPLRTGGTTPGLMRKLSGYEMVELDSGVSSDQVFWDQALSAGHYSFGMTGDDLHHPERNDCFGVRYGMLNCPSGRYADIKNTLLGGAYYCVSTSAFDIPRIESIGMKSDTLFVELDRPVFIRVYGQDHQVLNETDGNQTSLSYVFGEDDTFARFQIYCPEGAFIYTNPFARYDASVSSTPYRIAPHGVNVLLTVLYNLALLALAFFCIRLLFK